MTKTTDLTITRCNEIVAKYSLLNHSFYKRWSDGTLAVESLRIYAKEYGAFIRIIGEGWKAVDKPEVARVEDGHARVWESTFADALGATVNGHAVPEMGELLAISRALFAQRPTVLGALFAIEAQQPPVAKAKLKGLTTHYTDLPAHCGDYFRLHSEDYGEISILTEEISELIPQDRQKVVAACETMCRALYRALTGIEAVETNS
jgi:pyrroloquinoline-quinone synthase